FHSKWMVAALGTSTMMGARFRGCERSGGASTSDLLMGPPEEIFAFCHCPSSTFSLPRRTSALPLATVISLSFDCGSDFTDARLLGRICATVSSTLTAACEFGELQFGVERSTAPVLMRTAVLACSCVTLFSSRGTRVAALMDQTIQTTKVILAADSVAV